MLSAAQRFAAFTEKEPVVAQALIAYAKRGGERGVEALAQASGIAPAELRTLLGLDLKTQAPLARLAPVVADAAHGGARAGATAGPLLAAKRTKDAHALIAYAHDAGMTREAVTAMTEVLPAEAFRLIAASGVSLRLLASTEDELLHPSVRAARLLGPAFAVALGKENREQAAGGYNHALLNEITVYHHDSPARLRTCIVHELMHTLDRCVWKRDKRSLQNDWLDLHIAMQQAGRFPTRYSALSAEESFAEAATMYLTTHETTESGERITRDRAHLERHFPEVHAFMQRFFEVEVPATKQVPDRAETMKHFANYVAKVHAQAAPFLSVMRSEDAMRLGQDFLMIGRLRADDAALDIASAYLRQADTAEARALLGDIARARARRN